MRRASTILATLLLAATAVGTSGADDLQHVSQTDLANEVKNRRSDIARTKARIASLDQQQTQALTELSHAEVEAKKIEALLSVRANMFYRLHRNGGTLRYLMGSSSAVELLKRLGELKHLLQSCLESRKQAGMRLATAENRLASIGTEKETAHKMLAMLQQTLGELRSEQSRRRSTRHKVALR